jgi:hypothetical protein
VIFCFIRAPGEPTGSFDLSMVGTILIQEYRKEKPSLSAVLEESFFSSSQQSRPYPGTHKHSIRKNFSQKFPAMTLSMKLLFILFDFGREEPSINISYSKTSNPKICNLVLAPVLPWLAAQPRR